MSGIFGITSRKEVVEPILSGLQRLEYRGYDSAGVATLLHGEIVLRRTVGKLQQLRDLLARDPIDGVTGLGHTRWATFGAPTERNAQPQANSHVAIVQNGIIENYTELREELEVSGCRFTSDTDTEVAVHLITAYLNEGVAAEDAFTGMLERLRGIFAIAAMFANQDGLIFAARRGSPLVVGYGEDEMFLASDALALAPLTKRIAYLEDGDWVQIAPGGARFHNAGGVEVSRPTKEISLSGTTAKKGRYRHFMEKEIHDQPEAVAATLAAYLEPQTQSVHLPELPVDLALLDRITIVGSGATVHASAVGKHWMGMLCGLPVEVEIASELRYRDVSPGGGGLSIFVSQSGESADTLAALRRGQMAGQCTIAVVNVPESTIAREADVVLPTLAGPEIGVASTKSFTAQIIVLACLSIAIGRARAVIDADRANGLSTTLTSVPDLMRQLFDLDKEIHQLASNIVEAQHMLFLGRGSLLPVVQEAALLFRELAYVWAIGLAAGEVKHGSIALVDQGTNVIALGSSKDPAFDKTLNNIFELAARGAEITLIADRAGLADAPDTLRGKLEMPLVDPLLAPLVFSVPMQLLAYHVAALKGTDVDQPRNLAKSVTVE